MSESNNKKPLLPDKCERCGCRSRFPLRKRNIRLRDRLRKTTPGPGKKMICARCEGVIFKADFKADPSIPTNIKERWS